MFELVIFDLDGTLLNTIDDICDSMNHALKDCCLPTISVDECKYMVGSGVRVLVEKAVADPKDYDVVEEKYMFYYNKFQKNKTKPYEHVVDIIKAIKDENIKVAVLTNKPHEDALKVIDYYFGLSLFDCVIGKKPQNQIKPAIDGCIEILHCVKIRADKVLYIGDTNVDMQTAKNANFISVAVTWGFRLQEELEDYHYIIDDPKDIMKIIRGIK